MDGETLVLEGDVSPLRQSLNNAGALFETWRKKVTASDAFKSLKANGIQALESIAATFDKIAERGGVVGILRDQFIEFGQVAGEAIASGMGRATEAVVAFSTAAQAALIAVFGPGGVIFSAIGKVVGYMSSAFNVITGVITAPFYALTSVVSKVFSGIKSLASAALSTVTSLFSGLFERVKAGVSGMLSAISQLAPLLGASIQEGLSVGFAELKQDEMALAKLEGLIQSTGSVAGWTSQQLQKMASSLASASGQFGGDDFTSGLATLLQFKNVRGDVFEGAAKAAADLAAVTGDLGGAFDKLGRALDDPIKGVRLLRSEGVKFTEDEVKQIDAMIAAGRVMEAQRAILQRVGETYKGNAARAADTFSGQVHKLNEALKDQWSAFANALTPALKAVIPYLIAGAERAKGFAERLGGLVQATVDWAKGSTTVIKQWYDYAVKIFQDISNWIIDKFATAFAFVQTAVQDLPGTFDVLKAKAAATWESMSQTLASAWETVSVTIENVWATLLHKLKLLYIDFATEVKKGIVDVAVQTGQITKQQASIAKDALDAAGKLQKDQEKGRFSQRKEAVAKGPSDEAKARLADLEKEANALAESFGAKFGANLEKNKAFFDKLKEGLKSFLGGAAEFELDENGKPKPKNSPFTFSKDPEDGSGKKGEFEDIASLQKRITSAAAKDPTTSAVTNQTAVITKNFQEWKKEKADERERQKRIEESNKEFLKKFDQLAAEGGTLG